MPQESNDKKEPGKKRPRAAGPFPFEVSTPERAVDGWRIEVRYRAVPGGAALPLLRLLYPDEGQGLVTVRLPRALRLLASWAEEAVVLELRQEPAADLVRVIPAGTLLTAIEKLGEGGERLRVESLPLPATTPAPATPGASMGRGRASAPDGRRTWELPRAAAGSQSLVRSLAGARPTVLDRLAGSPVGARLLATATPAAVGAASLVGEITARLRKEEQLPLFRDQLVLAGPPYPFRVEEEQPVFPPGSGGESLLSFAPRANPEPASFARRQSAPAASPARPYRSLTSFQAAPAAMAALSALAAANRNPAAMVAVPGSAITDRGAPARSAAGARPSWSAGRGGEWPIGVPAAAAPLSVPPVPSRPGTGSQAAGATAPRTAAPAPTSTPASSQAAPPSPRAAASPAPNAAGTARAADSPLRRAPARNAASRATANTGQGSQSGTGGAARRSAGGPAARGGRQASPSVQAPRGSNSASSSGPALARTAEPSALQRVSIPSPSLPTPGGANTPPVDQRAAGPLAPMLAGAAGMLAAGAAVQAPLLGASPALLVGGNPGAAWSVPASVAGVSYSPFAPAPAFPGWSPALTVPGGGLPAPAPSSFNPFAPITAPVVPPVPDGPPTPAAIPVFPAVGPAFTPRSWPPVGETSPVPGEAALPVGLEALRFSRALVERHILMSDVATPPVAARILETAREILSVPVIAPALPAPAPVLPTNAPEPALAPRPTVDPAPPEPMVAPLAPAPGSAPPPSPAPVPEVQAPSSTPPPAAPTRVPDAPRPAAPVQSPPAGTGSDGIPPAPGTGYESPVPGGRSLPVPRFPLPDSPAERLGDLGTPVGAGMAPNPSRFALPVLPSAAVAGVGGLIGAAAGGGVRGSIGQLLGNLGGSILTAGGLGAGLGREGTPGMVGSGGLPPVGVLGPLRGVPGMPDQSGWYEGDAAGPAIFGVSGGLDVPGAPLLPGTGWRSTGSGPTPNLLPGMALEPGGMGAPVPGLALPRALSPMAASAPAGFLTSGSLTPGRRGGPDSGRVTAGVGQVGGLWPSLLGGPLSPGGAPGMIAGPGLLLPGLAGVAGSPVVAGALDGAPTAMHLPAGIPGGPAPAGVMGTGGVSPALMSGWSSMPFGGSPVAGVLGLSAGFAGMARGAVAPHLGITGQPPAVGAALGLALSLPGTGEGKAVTGMAGLPGPGLHPGLPGSGGSGPGAERPGILSRVGTALGQHVEGLKLLLSTPLPGGVPNPGADGLGNVIGGTPSFAGDGISRAPLSSPAPSRQRSHAQPGEATPGLVRTHSTRWLPSLLPSVLALGGHPTPVPAPAAGGIAPVLPQFSPAPHAPPQTLSTPRGTQGAGRAGFVSPPGVPHLALASEGTARGVPMRGVGHRASSPAAALLTQVHAAAGRHTRAAERMGAAGHLQVAPTYPASHAFVPGRPVAGSAPHAAPSAPPPAPRNVATVLPAAPHPTRQQPNLVLASVIRDLARESVADLQLAPAGRPPVREAPPAPAAPRPDAGGKPQSAGNRGKGPSPMEMDMLARQVYRIVRQKLAVERERRGGF